MEIQKAKDEGRFRVRSPEQIRQNQLPGLQKGLAERIEALTEDLARVGGVAFVYANKEIKTAMDGVHGRLAEGQTNRPTQWLAGMVATTSTGTKGSVRAIGGGAAWFAAASSALLRDRRASP